jgi:hypothetical protein
LAVEEESAPDSGDLGFMARAMTLCTLPHSDPKAQEFIRRNGDYTMTMLAPKAIGLPYGSIPRLLLAWISSEATRTGNRVLVLGGSLSKFMRELGLTPTGGEKGDITRLRDQMRRLFACSIHCNYSTSRHDAGMTFHFVDDYSIWWHPQAEEHAGTWRSTLTLSEKFFNEITQSPVPIDIRVLKALKRSPMALDLYIWLTFRNSYLKKTTLITWQQLQMQFGAEYARTDNFKMKFNDAKRKVSIMYPDAKIQSTLNGILISPCKPHISKSGRKKLLKT